MSYPVYGVLMKVVSFPSNKCLQGFGVMKYWNEWNSNLIVFIWRQIQLVPRLHFHRHCCSTGMEMHRIQARQGRFCSGLQQIANRSRFYRQLSYFSLETGDNLFTVPLSKDCNRFLNQHSTSRSGKWLSTRRLVWSDLINVNIEEPWQKHRWVQTRVAVLGIFCQLHFQRSFQVVNILWGSRGARKYEE